MNDKQHAQVETRARDGYARARRSVFWRSLRARLAQSCNDLLATADVLAHLADEARLDRGVHKVPIRRIVGSAGRYHDFDLAFSPRHEAVAERWLSVARARLLGVYLPPPTLLQIGDAYFVEDGNHRVSVARTLSQNEIEAHVTEIETASLVPDATCTRLGFRLEETATATAEAV